jgi:hypothetical protein
MELCSDLRAQFLPRTPSERQKLEDMAQAWWLQRRARNLQTLALEEGNEKALALNLRYETTQRRSYQMAFKDFEEMRKARVAQKASPDNTPIVASVSFQSERQYSSQYPTKSEAQSRHPVAALAILNPQPQNS